ncbi:MAG: DUF3696 domain-containing protein, partial [Promethearchaeota archaeon]
LKSLKNYIKEINSIISKIERRLRVYEDAKRDIIKIFKNIYYVGPLRVNFKRYYTIIVGDLSDIGPEGEDAPYLLYSDFLQGGGILKRIEKNLQKFELLKTIKLKNISTEAELFSIICKEYYSGTQVNIADMGFGVSQLLPIIIEGFIIPKNSMILIEQPEIHLHPKSQSNLADLFIEIMNEGKKLLIETHSIYLLNRIQRRIAEKQISNEDIIIYYITLDNKGSNLKKLELDENGFLQEIPEGFFDEDFRETSMHMDAILKKINKKKPS